MAQDLERLVVQLSADITKYERSLARAQQAANQNFSAIERRGAQHTQRLNSTLSGFKGLGKDLFSGFNAGVLSALVPLASLSGAILGTKKALADLGKIADDVKVTGLKPELFQALGLAAREAGVDQEGLNAALNIFAKNVGLAESGTGPLVAGLKKLNPELLKALTSAKDQNERFRLVSEALHNMGSATQRAALESVIFGKAGVKLGEVLAAGNKGLDEFIRKGHEMGVIISDDMLANVDDLSDKLDVLEFAISSNLSQALITLAPLLISVAEGTASFAKEVKEVSEAINAFSADPTLEKLGKLFQFRLVEGGLADQIRDLFSKASDATDQGVQDIRAKLAVLKKLEASGIDVHIGIEQAEAALDKLQESGERSATAVKDDIKSVEAEIALLKNLAAAGADVHIGIERAESNLKRLQDELIRVGQIAQEVGKQVSAAFGSIAEDRATRDRSGAEAGASFAGRQSDAGRSAAQRELDTRAEEVHSEALKKGIELTQEASRVEAERELALEHAQEAREKADKDTLKDANKDRERQNELIKNTIAGLKEETASIQFETEHMSDSNAERERARIVTETLNRLTAEGIDITDDLRATVQREADARFQQVAAYDATAAAAEAAADAAEELKQKQEELAQQMEEVNDAFKDSFKTLLSDLAHGKSLTDALTNALGRLADRLIDIGVNGIGDSLFGGQTGGGGGVNAGGLLSGLLGGGGGGAAQPFKTNTTFSQFLGAGGSSGAATQLSNTFAHGMVSGATKAVNSGGVAGNIWSFFAGKGLKDFQVAGILGNVSAESSFNPTAVGDSGHAFGLFQHNDRSPALFSAIGGKGNLADVSKQLEFAWTELQTTEKKALDALKASTDVRSATAAFAGFERPQGFSWDNPEGAHRFTERLSGAEAALSKFGGTTDQATSVVGNLGQAGAAASNGLAEAAKSAGSFGSILQSFMGSASGGGSGWFQGLMGLFGGAGGAFNFMNSISPAATSSILGAGGGFTGLYAGGTASASAGWAWVGERGPELMRLRGGEEILGSNMSLPRLSRYGSSSHSSGRVVNVNAPMTVYANDAQSFVESQNQIANKASATYERAFRVR